MTFIIETLEHIGHRCLELADAWRERYGLDRVESIIERAEKAWR